MTNMDISSIHAESAQPQLVHLGSFIRFQPKIAGSSLYRTPVNVLRRRRNRATWSR